MSTSAGIFDHNTDDFGLTARAVPWLLPSGRIPSPNTTRSSAPPEVLADSGASAGPAAGRARLPPESALRMATARHATTSLTLSSRSSRSISFSPTALMLARTSCIFRYNKMYRRRSRNTCSSGLHEANRTGPTISSNTLLIANCHIRLASNRTSPAPASGIGAGGGLRCATRRRTARHSISSINANISAASSISNATSTESNLS